MAQYREIRTGYPLEFASGGCEFRYRAEGGILYIDETITGTGFDGVEDTDWSSIDDFTLPAITRNVFRIGTRGGYLIYDQEIDATGFSGTIGVNWDNIEQHSLAVPTTTTTSTSTTSTSTTSTTTSPGVEVTVFDNVDDYIGLSSDLGVDIEGSKTVTFSAYLDSNIDVSPFCMFAFKSTDNQDYLAAVWEPGNNRIELRYSEGPSSTQYYSTVGYEDQNISCEVIKTGVGDGMISSFKINTNTIAPSGTSSTSEPASSTFGNYDPSFLSKYFSIWDITVAETGGADLHTWLGYPGDQSSGWEDQVGSIDGTVFGSPATRFL